MSEENIDPNMNIVIIIDKDRLPEELRNKLPQDLQNRLVELLQEKTTTLPVQSRESNLFAVQHGTVIGNIYKDGIIPEELGCSEHPDQEIPIQKEIQDDIREEKVT